MTTTYNPKSEAVDTVTSTVAGVAGSNAKAAESASKKQRKAASAFRTISEVADDLDVQQHVLRFWETKFSQVKPLKRGGGRRYYRPEDVALLKKIHNLLYTEGYTIKGVQKLLKGQGKQQAVADMDLPTQATKPAANQAGSATAAHQQTQQPQQAAAPRQQAAQMPPIEPKSALNEKQRSILKAMLGDLKELRDTLISEGPGKA